MAGSTLAALDRLRGRGVVRDVDEEHRTATPLELFFDLIFVVAIARAAAALHHELAADHVADGVLGFMGVFFAVWWAWMNFTWFASAHDSGDVPYRLLTFVQMTGALVVAVGVTDALEHGDWLVVTVGYGIMRVALAVNWLRVARDQPAVRFRCRRYAAGVVAMQVLWFARLALPDALATAAFPLLVLGELAVPVWAERASPRPIFHPEHIEERYGLFTIIVLGESVLSAATGFQTALADEGLTASLFTVGVGGLLLAFTAWWLYFDHPGHLTPDPTVSFHWGYGHVVIFAALAAMGAGLHVATEAVTGHAGSSVAALAVAIPVAGFLLGLVLVMVLTGTPVRSPRTYPLLAGAGVILVLGAVASPAFTVAGAAAVMLVLAGSTVVSTTGPGDGHAPAGAPGRRPPPVTPAGVRPAPRPGSSRPGRRR